MSTVARGFPTQIARTTHAMVFRVHSAKNRTRLEKDVSSLLLHTYKKRDGVTFFYDLEIYQDDPLPGTNKKPHVVNYVVAMSFCSDCNAQPCEACEETHHFSGLGGGNAMYKFCFWATSDPINRHSVFIAHNAKSFDAHFVLDYLVTEGNTPELVMQGGKILKIRVKSTDVTFIDSLSFISMPLADFSKTFDLPDTVKGCFPHLFNHPDNYTYDGMLPTLNYYDPDGMKEKSREKLLQWHAEHKFDNFVFYEELKNYCVADVALLKAGCMKFRASFLDATGSTRSQSRRLAWKSFEEISSLPTPSVSVKYINAKTYTYHNAQPLQYQTTIPPTTKHTYEHAHTYIQ